MTTSSRRVRRDGGDSPASGVDKRQHSLGQATRYAQGASAARVSAAAQRLQRPGSAGSRVRASSRRGGIANGTNKPLPTLRPSFSPRPMGIERTSWALSTGRNRGSLRWHAIPIGRMKASYSRDSTTCGLTRKQNRGSLENKNRTLLLQARSKLVQNNGSDGEACATLPVRRRGSPRNSSPRLCSGRTQRKTNQRERRERMGNQDGRA